jgi:hypothetical protein
VPIFPIWADTEEPDRLHFLELDLIVGQLGRRCEAARQAGFAGALGAGTLPAEHLEVIGGLMAVGPLDREQATRTIGKDVERPFPLGRVYRDRVGALVRRLRRRPARA